MRELEVLPSDIALDILETQTPQTQLAAKIRSRLNNGQVLIDYWLGVLRNPRASEANKLKASELLAQRGWGKAPVIMDVKVETGQSIDDIPLDELKAMAEALKRGAVVDAQPARHTNSNS